MAHEKAERLTRMHAVVALLMAALLASCRIDEAGSDNDRFPAQYQEAVLEMMTRYHIPGVVAGVWIPGHAPWKIAQGVADVQTRRPISLSDYFPIRSVTKSFTVTVLLQLVRDGAVSLDDAIDRYVPGIPNGDQITLMQLAAMESGIKDYLQVDAFLEKFISNPHSRAATNGPEYNLYGLGIGSLHGWWGHTGSGVGFQAATFRDLDTGTTIAVLVNATPTTSPGRELNLAQEIFAALANVVDRR